MQKEILKFLVFGLVIMVAFDAYTQIGKVGINTTTPVTMLHVKDSSVLFKGSVTLPSTPD